VELSDKGEIEQMIDDDMSDTVVKLDNWEGERLPSREYCPECGPNVDVFVKRGQRRRLVAHCATCDYPVITLKPSQVFCLVRWLRAKRGVRVHALGGGGAAA
jgi:hypothetical protein